MGTPKKTDSVPKPRGEYAREPIASTSALEFNRGPPWNDGPIGAESWTPADETSATKPGVMAPPLAPRPDTAKMRSPVRVAGVSVAQGSRGWFALLTISSARSRSSCQLQSVAFTSSSPWRTNTCGPGWRGAAPAGPYQPSRDGWPASDAPPEAAPAPGLA